jgi:lysophospholipase L1-like esterase
MLRRALAMSLVTCLLAGFLACGGGGEIIFVRGDAGAARDAGAPDGPSADANDPPRDSGVDAPLDALDARADGAGDAAMDGPAGPPEVRFIGRFDTTDPAGPRVAWPGAQIVARFSGTELKATFSDAPAEDQPSHWDVTVDGTVNPTPLALTPAAKTYTLATGLTPGAHVVELRKRTEAKAGVTQFLGFDYSGGALLAPPPARVRRIEFLGDSNANGYGIEGAGPACSYTPATQNERKSFGALAAAALGADHHNLAQSGVGVLLNYVRADPNVMEILYTRALPGTPGSTYDFTKFDPDVVWITLGGNDWAGEDPDAPAPLTMAQFQAKYSQLVALVRTKRPGAHLVCAVGASLSNDYPVGYNAYTNVKTAITNVVAARTTAGDTKIYTYEYARATAADRTACAYHFNAAKHASLATETVAFIKSKTGW